MKNFISAILIVAGLSTSASAQKPTPAPISIVNRSPEQPAQFPGCEDKEAEMKLGCAQQKLNDFFKANMKYPKTCMKDSIQGIAFVAFTVDTVGRISNVSINKKSAHPALDKEAIRIVKLMDKMKTKWIPARHEGKLVTSELVIPVKFKIPKAPVAETPPEKDEEETAPLK